MIIIIIIIYYMYIICHTSYIIYHILYFKKIYACALRNTICRSEKRSSAPCFRQLLNCVSNIGVLHICVFAIMMWQQVMLDGCNISIIVLC
jgi:hypothetical protein